MANNKYGAWLAKIPDHATADAMARECALVMLFWSAVQAVFAFKYGSSLVIHAVVLAAGGIGLLRWKSRSAAVGLALYALANAALTLAINAGVALDGGKNLALALMIAWTAVKALEATFRLHGRFAFPSIPGSAQS